MDMIKTSIQAAILSMALTASAGADLLTQNSLLAFDSPVSLQSQPTPVLSVPVGEAPSNTIPLQPFDISKPALNNAVPIDEDPFGQNQAIAQFGAHCAHCDHRGLEILSGHAIVHPQSGTLSAWCRIPGEGLDAGVKHLVVTWNDETFAQGQQVFWLQTDNAHDTVIHMQDFGNPFDRGFTAPSTFGPGWHHLVFTWDGQHRAIYHNGIQIGFVDAPGHLASAAKWVGLAQPYCLDAMCPRGSNFHAYGRVLTATEVADLYVDTSPEASVGRDDIFPGFGATEEQRANRAMIELEGELVSNDLDTEYVFLTDGTGNGTPGTQDEPRYFADANDWEERLREVEQRLGGTQTDSQYEAVLQDLARLQTEAFMYANQIYDVEIYSPDDGYNGEPLEPAGEPLFITGQKVIFLISGAPSVKKQILHITDSNGNQRLELVPEIIAEKRLKNQEQNNEKVARVQQPGVLNLTPTMVGARKNLLEKYTSHAFVNDGWRLVFLRASNRAQIDGALHYIKKHFNPRQLVVHYFGHGESNFYADGDYTTGDDPYLYLSQYVDFNIRINGQLFPIKRPRELGPAHASMGNRIAAMLRRIDVVRRWHQAASNDTQATGYAKTLDALESELAELRDQQQRLEKTPTSREDHFAYFTRDLALKLAYDFDAGLNNPILIVDGCEIARTLDFKSDKIDIVVSVDLQFASVALGAFSEVFAGSVTLESLHHFHSRMPDVLSDVNSKYIGQVQFLKDNRMPFPLTKTGQQNPTQQASMTTSRRPF